MQLLDRTTPADLQRNPGPLFEPLGHAISLAFGEHAIREENGSGLHPGAPPENPLLIANRYVPRVALTSPHRESWLPENLVPIVSGAPTKPPAQGEYCYGLDELELMRSCVEGVGTASRLVGSVGCGKTFLLKYFRACLCPELNKYRPDHPALLPIYFDGNIQRSARHRAVEGARFAAAEEGQPTDWYATTIQDIEDMQTHLAKSTADALNWFAESRSTGHSVEAWPAWLHKKPLEITLDDILDTLPTLQAVNKFQPVFLLDNLDRMSAAHQAAACFLAEAITTVGGCVVLSLRPETYRHLVRALDNLSHSHINLETHNAALEEAIIRSILKLRLVECRGTLQRALGIKPLMLGDCRVSVKDAEVLIGELLAAVVHEDTIKRLRILTSRNRRYLLEAVAFLLSYAPLPDEVPACIALGVVEDDAMDPEYLERWRRQRYPFIRDGLMTGPYLTFIPAKVRECRWLRYMVNLFCNGRSTMACNWTIRLNLLFAAQHSRGRVLLVGSLWNVWSECCAIEGLSIAHLYRNEFNQALASLINAGMLETPSVYSVPTHTKVRGGWKLGITELGRFYLDTCLTNLAYVRFAKDSIEWRENPSWADEPRTLKLAGDTLTGPEKAENIARTLELLATEEMEWMRDRIRPGDGQQYAALFTDGQCGCSIYGSIAQAMLRHIKKFEVVDVSRAKRMLEDTVKSLRRESAIAKQAT